MAEIVTAVYEKGVLRPLQPLNLRERQTVRLQIFPEEPDDKVEEVIQSLVTAGLMRPRPKRGTPPPDPVSEEERRRLADIMGRIPGKPLSEIIVEERGEW
jgi:predicted DNA-binding antitoxin AbrB/MazE fold protein